MVPIAHPDRKRLKGFSLVEIMVAMVIGMFGIIVMMQVLALSEERKRTATGGSDASSEGVMALYALQRDIRVAGYGIGDTKVLGCNLLLPSGVTLNAMAPVTINHASITGQDAHTDTLLVVYGKGNGTPQGDVVSSTGSVVQTPSAFTANDFVIEAPTISPHAAVCNLTLSQVTSVLGSVVSLNTGGMTKGDTLFNLGQTLKIAGYAIRGGNLTLCDYTANDCSSAGNWVPIANNIVSLRAQYGRHTSGTLPFIVDVYDQTTPAAAAATTACNWTRISAVRLVLVARSAQYEKTNVTSELPVDVAAGAAPPPAWDGTNVDNPVGSAASPIDLSGYANWRQYRYKVFQTVVPIRNISWMLAC